jgi:hypothetical protein
MISTLFGVFFACNFLNWHGIEDGKEMGEGMDV